MRELDPSDVFCLKAFWSLAYFKFNQLTLVERLVTIHLNCGEVNKNILPGLALNEPKTFGRVEPLHHTLFSSHLVHPSSKNLPTRCLAIPVCGLFER